jgi:hypothetical protein
MLNPAPRGGTIFGASRLDGFDVSDKTGVPSEALRVVAPKQLPHAGKLESAFGAFNEQAHTRECSQQAIEAAF